MHLNYLVRPFEFKSLDQDVQGSFSGYGSVFGNIDSYDEIVAAGAFKKSLKEIKASGRKIPALWNHNSDEPVGVYKSIAEDEIGLPCEGLLQIKVGRGLEVYELSKMGAVQGMSIGYITKNSSTDHETGIRTLKEIELWEISLVTFPANKLATLTDVKSAMQSLETLADCEGWLRDAARLTRSQAKQFISQIKNASNPRDADQLAEIKAKLRNIRTLI